VSAVLFRGGSVVDVGAGLTRPADLLVRDGRVVDVGTGLAADGAEVVDCAGRTLMPGLISLHAHPGMMVGLRMDPGGMTRERVERDLEVWLRYGVTTVQSMGTDRPFAFDVARERGAGRARLLSVGHGFGVAGGVPPFQMEGEPGPLRESDLGKLSAALEDLARRRASGVKLWYDDWYGQFPKMASEVARHIIETCGRLGLRSYAHVYRVDDAKELIRFGLSVLAHMPRDRTADAELVALMRARDVAVIPTLTVPESNVVFLDRPAFVDDPLYARFLPEGSREHLRSEAFLESVRAKKEFPYLRDDLARAIENVGILYRGGVRFGFGTGAGVSNRVIGFSEHRELELLVAAGVSAPDAVRMATLGSAEVLGREYLGELAPGRVADIVVLRADPLADIRNVRAVDSVCSRTCMRVDCRT
jgi:imidazolonepropionase-like amidohydrolase